MIENNTIAVVVFDGISPFHLSVPCLVFGEDRQELGLPRFALRICAVEPGMLTTSAGFGLYVDTGLEGLVGAGIVIMPSWRGVENPPPEVLLTALNTAHDAGACVVGLCLGAFVLAAAGLLDERPATTHWHWSARLAEKFPKVRVDPRVLYIDDGDILTSAGTAAALDCCLHLVRRHFGAQIANRLARRLVIPPHRQGSQAQFIEQPLPQDRGGDRMSATLVWCMDHLNTPLTIDTLATHTGMSRRTFTRHFRRLTGQTVGAWLIGQRLALAQRLLETTSLSIDHIASRTGFGTALSLRLHFVRAFNTTPATYRREFRNMGTGNMGHI